MALKSKPLDQVRPDVPLQAVAPEEIARVNVNIPLALRQRWKVAAAQANRSMTDLIVEAMDKHLNAQNTQVLK